MVKRLVYSLFLCVMLFGWMELSFAQDEVFYSDGTVILGQLINHGGWKIPGLRNNSFTRKHIISEKRREDGVVVLEIRPQKKYDQFPLITVNYGKRNRLVYRDLCVETLNITAYQVLGRVVAYWVSVGEVAILKDGRHESVFSAYDFVYIDTDGSGLFVLREDGFDEKTAEELNYWLQKRINRGTGKP